MGGGRVSDPQRFKLSGDVEQKGGGGVRGKRSPSPVWYDVGFGIKRTGGGTDAGQGALAKQFTVHEAPDGRRLTSGEVEIGAQSFCLELRRRRHHRRRDLSRLAAIIHLVRQANTNANDVKHRRPASVRRAVRRHGGQRWVFFFLFF